MVQPDVKFDPSLTPPAPAPAAPRSPVHLTEEQVRFFDEGGSLMPDEHSTKASLVPVIDLARNKNVTSNESEIPASQEVRPASRRPVVVVRAAGEGKRAASEGTR